MNALCVCRHVKAAHNVNRRMCYGSPVCACSGYRPKQWPPAEQRDEYDPGAEPVERRPS